MAEKAVGFAGKLRELREAAGLSKYALAKLSGVTQQAIGNLEAGNREPTWQTVQLLARALGVDCRAFQDGEIELPPAEAPRPRGRPRKAQTADELPAPQHKPHKRRAPKPRG